MHISSSTLRLALLRLFQQAGMRTGDQFPFRDMERAWHSTGLRTSDLRDAVRLMHEDGELQRVGQDFDLSFALTAKARSAQDLQADPAFEEDSAALVTVSQRVRLGYAPEKRRRASDAVEL